MNEQELIERLRDEYIVVSRTETADCIEQLVKERDELGRKLNTARYGQPDFAWSIHEEELADLRVKLTKAMGALRFYANFQEFNKAAITVLAELEGEKIA